jgi:hypothetical protein
MKSKNDIKSAFERTLAKTDEQLKLVGASESGSTCCLVFVKSNGNSNKGKYANNVR